MLEEEGADGDYAEQGVEFVPEKGGSLAGAQGWDTAPEGGRGRLLSSGHGICQLLEAAGSKFMVRRRFRYAGRKSLA